MFVLNGRDAPQRLPVRAKAPLLIRVWWLTARTTYRIRRIPLPALVEGLATTNARRRLRLDPARLGRVVDRSVRIRTWSPRCLVRALVLFELLREQGDTPVLVIGLHREPRSKDAHAWIEVAGVDVGPAPGGRSHVALARYPVART